jgi:hypothetical protein
MVHALREAWRVLRADALLIDLRPAIAHGRVGLVRDGRFTVQWRTRESLASYRAASRSVAEVLGLGLFVCRSSSRFSCTTVFPAVETLRDWLHDWYETESAGRADALAKRVEGANERPELAGTLVAEVPFTLRAYKRREAPA